MVIACKVIWGNANFVFPQGKKGGGGGHAEVNNHSTYVHTSKG